MGYLCVCVLATISATDVFDNYCFVSKRATGHDLIITTIQSKLANLTGHSQFICRFDHSLFSLCRFAFWYFRIDAFFLHIAVCVQFFAFIGIYCCSIGFPHIHTNTREPHSFPLSTFRMGIFFFFSLLLVSGHCNRYVFFSVIFEVFLYTLIIPFPLYGKIDCLLYIISIADNFFRFVLALSLWVPFFLFSLFVKSFTFISHGIYESMFSTDV